MIELPFEAGQDRGAVVVDGVVVVEVVNDINVLVVEVELNNVAIGAVMVEVEVGPDTMRAPQTPELAWDAARTFFM